jgi:hypothetical protein
VNDSFETTLILNHDIEIEKLNGNLKIISDDFNDKGPDNPDGIDVVNWLGENLTRTKPDLKRMPDYVIYHTPLEELGKEILESYTQSVQNLSSVTYTYDHTDAAWYINNYTSNTTLTCGDGYYQ